MRLRSFALLTVLSLALAGLALGCGSSDDPNGSGGNEATGNGGGGEGDGDGVDGAVTDDGIGNTTSQGYALQIIAPAGDPALQGPVQVEVVPVGRKELKLDELTVRRDDVVIFRDTKAPTSFVLDTRKHPNGSVSLVAEAKFEGEDLAAGIQRNFDNSEFAFVEIDADRAAYGADEVVTLQVTVNHGGAEFKADFSAMDSGYVPGSEVSYPISGNTHVIAYKISAGNIRPDGFYPIPLSATFGTSELVNDQVILQLRNLPEMPVDVRGCVFVQGEDLPLPDLDWPIEPPALTGSNQIITGGSAKLSVDYSALEDPAEVVGVIIGTAGNSGFCMVPVNHPEGLAELDLFLRAFRDRSAAPQQLTYQVALRDRRGRISPYGLVTMGVTPVGSGDIQVSVSWDSETDVDLHVVDPFNCEMYFGNKKCSSGGALDLDSNPGCSIDGINNENVFWENGLAPEGDYIVRVEYFSDCGDKDTNYTVTVKYCGRVETFDGFFAGGTSSSGGAGSGTTITSFNNRSCSTSVHGRVRYQDRAFDRWGFAADAWRPVRYARVELRRLSDNELLGVGQVGRDGRYEVQFTNDGAPGVFIQVHSTTQVEGSIRDITVLNHPKFDVIYTASSPPIFEDQVDDDSLEINLDISEELGAGAWNILDTLVDGNDRVRRMTGAELLPLTSYWATGQDTTDTLYCSGFFYEQGACTVRRALSVQGKDEDRDEYDDMVILKEFFKSVVDQLSGDDNPGGLYDSTRDDPRRAWSEGVSTFFACDALSSPHFVNSRPEGVYVVDDVEDMLSPFAFFSSTNTIDGEISPYLVSALLWDLRDEAGGEDHDALDTLSKAIYDVVFNYFGSGHYRDRGVLGVDLVDFLDGWLCRGWGRKEALEVLVSQHHQLPYDFAGPTDCGQ